MNGSHQTIFDAEIVVQHFSQRSKAVGGARGVRHDVLSGIGVVINAHDKHGGGVFGRRGQDHFLRACFDVRPCFFVGQEKAGRFQDIFRANLVPLQVFGVSFSRNPN